MSTRISQPRRWARSWESPAHSCSSGSTTTASPYGAAAGDHPQRRTGPSRGAQEEPVRAAIVKARITAWRETGAAAAESLGPELLRTLYEQLGLSTFGIELVTGRTQRGVQADLTRAGITLRPRLGYRGPKQAAGDQPHRRHGMVEGRVPRRAMGRVRGDGDHRRERSGVGRRGRRPARSGAMARHHRRQPGQRSAPGRRQRRCQPAAGRGAGRTRPRAGSCSRGCG